MGEAKKTTAARLERSAHLAWVPLCRMRIRPEGQGQREFRINWARELASGFDPDKFETPTVNDIDGWCWVIDGQHRIEAYKIFLGDGRWSDQSVQCWVHKGLTIAQECDLFLALNTKKTVDAYAKFVNAVQAGHPDESRVESIVRLKGLKIARRRGDGAMSCVTTLMKVDRRGEGILARSLDISYRAFGDAALDGVIIDGVSLVCSRFNGELRDSEHSKKLGDAPGGIGGLMSKASILKKQTGASMPHCVAAAIIDTINRGSKKKLASWWKRMDA